MKLNKKVLIILAPICLIISMILAYQSTDKKEQQNLFLFFILVGIALLIIQIIRIMKNKTI